MKFFDINYNNISKADLRKALEQIVFIRNTTGAGQKLIKPLSIAISCMEKCLEDKE